MSLFQLILFGALGVLVFPALVGFITLAICKIVFNTKDTTMIFCTGISVVCTLITGIVFLAMALSRVLS